MNAADQRRLTPILAALTVALGAGVLLLAVGVGRGAHWNAPSTLPPLPTATAANRSPPAKPLQQFALVWQKPLFNPDRQPLARATNGSSSIGDFTLTGVIMTPTLRMALLHDRKGKKELRVREGQASADGSVTLVKVQPRSAIFDSPAGRVELHLPSGAPARVLPSGPATAGVRQGPPMDSRAMAAMTPPDAAAMPEGAAGNRPNLAMRAPAMVHDASPAAAAPADPARQPAAHAASAPATDRIREIVRQRRAAQAAASPEGSH